MTGRRTWLPFAVAAGIALACGAAVLVPRLVSGESSPRCATSAAARSPLVAPDRFAEDDRLATLAGSVGAMGPPFGTVRVGVGYNYDQWLHLYGVGGDLLGFTKNNADLTLVDRSSLEPRWALKPAAKRIAWDASADRLALLDLSAAEKVRVGSYDLRSGREKWCVALSARHQDGQPVSTTFLDDGDLLVVLPGSTGLQVASLSGTDGKVLWTGALVDAGRADFLGQLGDGLVLAGGTEEYRLAGASSTTSDRPAITAFRSDDGTQAWSWSPGPGRTAHVIGTSDGRVLVMATGDRGYELVALDDEDGSELWRVPTRAFESTLRGGVIVTKSAAVLDGYSAQDGSLLWRLPLPTDRTYFPYGFTLGQMPSLDADHVLLPTTTALEILDVRKGSKVAYPLPVDGVSTTYWPYQLVVTDDLLGVVTNTGAVVVQREPPDVQPAQAP